MVQMCIVYGRNSCISVKCGYEMMQMVILASILVIKYVHMRVISFLSKKIKYNILFAWLR